MKQSSFDVFLPGLNVAVLQVFVLMAVLVKSCSFMQKRPFVFCCHVALFYHCDIYFVRVSAQSTDICVPVFVAQMNHLEN